MNYLTPEFIESKRQEIMKDGIPQGDADRHIAEFLKDSLGDESQFSQRYNFLTQRNNDPRAVSAFLDYSIYGTTNPIERWSAPVSPIQYAGREMQQGTPKELANLGAEALPTAGMLLGGAVGAVAGLPAAPLSAGASSFLGGVAGAGIGAGIGEQGKQAAQRLLGTAEPMTTGEELKNIGISGVEGAGTELLAGGALKGISAVAKSPVGQSVAKWLGEKIPSRLINSVLKPLSKEFDFAKNPGQAVVEEKIVASTKGALKDAIIAKKNEVGSLLRSAIENASKGAKKAVIDLEPLIVRPIKDAMLAAKKRGETALYNALVDLMDGLTKNFVEEGGTIVAKGAKPLQVIPLGAWEEKQSVGEGMRWTGQAFDKDLNQVKLKIFSNLKNALTESVPEAKDLFRRYANLLGAQKSMERQMSIIERQALVGLRATGLGTIAGLGSLVTGSSPSEATMKGIAASALFGALGTTPSKTLSAQALKLIPKGVGLAIQTIEKLAPAEKALILSIIHSINSPEQNQSPESQSDNGSNFP